jgi:hypothetical protein
VVRKIPDPLLRIDILNGIAKVMYTDDGSKGNNAVARAQEKLQDMSLQFPAVS